MACIVQQAILKHIILFIAIGHKKKKQLFIQKLHHPNYLKKALYYHELLEKGDIESQTALANEKYEGQTNLGAIETIMLLLRRYKVLRKSRSDYSATI